MKSVKKQLIQLIRTLKQADKPMTSASLANTINVSPRSVKSYISEINATLEDTILSSRQGYLIDQEKADELLKESKSLIPQTADERVIFIINKLIKTGMENAFDLCDEMFISYSTLKADLVKVRKMLADTDLELINQNDMLFINGLEKNKRKLLSNLIYSESHNHFVDTERISNSFEGLDATFIKVTILKKFEEHHYFINDYSLENLILHSTITIDRIRNGFAAKENKAPVSPLKLHEADLARSIIREFEQEYDITFNDTEVAEFTLLILSRASNLDYETVTIDNVRQYVGEKIYDLSNKLIQDFSNYFYIDLSQPEFFVRFALHIKNLLVRADSDYFSKNPLTDSIKQNCPLIYDCAVNAAKTITEETGITLTDDEIAYIAFHLGGALEMQNAMTNKLSAYIFCPGYYNINARLSESISSRFSDILILSGIITTMEELHKVSCDLIISTMNIDSEVAIPYVLISPFANENDLKNLAIKVNGLRQKKKRDTFKDNLSYLINEDLFTVTDTNFSKEDVIHMMADHLKELGYVGSNYESEVIERDSISSTAFGTFAIPHAMKMHEKKTGINVLITNDPIDWDGNEVKLVMMLCFNRNERYLFNELFEPISMILIDPDNFNEVLKAKSAEEFIDILSEKIT